MGCSPHLPGHPAEAGGIPGQGPFLQWICIHECFTWSVRSGPEADLVLTKKNGLFGFECKASDAPQRTSSMISAVDDLNLAKLFVIYPGEKAIVCMRRSRL
jgi:hypothetical protein